MNAREYILLARIDPTLAGTQIFTTLPWLLARNLPEFEPFVSIKPRNPIFQDTALQQAILAFHQRAGTLTPAISERLSTLKAGHIVRLSHQPNLFAYTKLIGQFISLELLSLSSNLTPLYYFIDYDTISDTHFSRSCIPDPTFPNGCRRLQFPRSMRAHRTAIANQTSIPTKDWLSQITNTIKAVANVYSLLNLSDGPIDLRLQRLLNDLDFAWKNGRNVADMNAILLSRFINLWLGIPTLFVPGSFLWSQVAPISLEHEYPTFGQLSEAVHQVNTELLQFGLDLSRPDKELQWLPWWSICSCGSRVGLCLTEDQTALGLCPHCKKEHRFRLTDEYWLKCSTNTAPKIVLHNFLNIAGFGYQAGVNHIGSAEHVLIHSLAMAHLSRPPLPQWLWECSGNFGTILEEDRFDLDMPFQREAAEIIKKGDASFVYFALCKAPEMLRANIERKIMGS